MTDADQVQQLRVEAADDTQIGLTDATCPKGLHPISKMHVTPGATRYCTGCQHDYYERYKVLNREKIRERGRLQYQKSESQGNRLAPEIP